MKLLKHSSFLWLQVPQSRWMAKHSMMVMPGEQLRKASKLSSTAVEGGWRTQLLKLVQGQRMRVPQKLRKMEWQQNSWQEVQSRLFWLNTKTHLSRTWMLERMKMKKMNILKSSSLQAMMLREQLMASRKYRTILITQSPIPPTFGQKNQQLASALYEFSVRRMVQLFMAQIKIEQKQAVSSSHFSLPNSNCSFLGSYLVLYSRKQMLTLRVLSANRIIGNYRSPEQIIASALRVFLAAILLSLSPLTKKRHCPQTVLFPICCPRQLSLQSEYLSSMILPITENRLRTRNDKRAMRVHRGDSCLMGNSSQCSLMLRQIIIVSTT